MFDIDKRDYKDLGINTLEQEYLGQHSDYSKVYLTCIFS